MSSFPGLAGSTLHIWPSPSAVKEHNEMFVCLRSMSSTPQPPVSFLQATDVPCAIPLKLLRTTLCSVFSAGEKPHNSANTAWEPVHSCRLFRMFVPSIMHESQWDVREEAVVINIDRRHDYEFVTQTGRSCLGLFFLKEYRKGQTVPSSFAGQSIDLIKEDDGGSNGPCFPKHLRAASATTEEAKTGQMFNGIDESSETQTWRGNTAVINPRNHTAGRPLGRQNWTRQGSTIQLRNTMIRKDFGV